MAFLNFDVLSELGKVEHSGFVELYKFRAGPHGDPHIHIVVMDFPLVVGFDEGAGDGDSDAFDIEKRFPFPLACDTVL